MFLHRHSFGNAVDNLSAS